MVTAFVFWCSLQMSYGERPEELYWGTVIVDLALIVAGVVCLNIAYSV